jgi:Ribbon-helix-helix protein, copG family
MKGYEESTMMRHTMIRFRVSDIELRKLEALAAKTGKTSMSEAIRYYIDTNYDREVLGLKAPCDKREQDDRK